jgi:signal transduction histidine kinase
MLKGINASALFRDRNGAVWVAAHQGGLLHTHDGRTDTFGRADGLSGEPPGFFFEDREGSIWVATPGGLDQFRNGAAATYSVSQGLASVSVDSVLSSRDGSVWISTLNGLNRFRNGDMWVYRGHHERARQEGLGDSAQQLSVREVVLQELPDGSGSLFEDRLGRIWLGSEGSIGYLENDRYVRLKGPSQDSVDGIAQDAMDNLWFLYRHLGLLRARGDRELQQISWSQLGGQGSASTLTADSKGDGIWLGFSVGGVAHFVDGKVRESYSALDGLAKGRVAYLQADPDGTLWVGAEGGLSRLKGGRITTLNRSGGLPCDSVDWMIKGDAGAVWVRTACGIVRIARSDLDAWAAAAADRTASANGKIPVTVFDDSEGVRSEDLHGNFSPHAARALDGRLWFATLGGVGVLDPGHLERNTLPPLVHVEEVVADRQTYEASSTLRLPPLVHELEIGYTALSLVAPEKIKFRYKLEGRDRHWLEAGNRRRAFDIDLPPGSYRFRVIASNGGGVWNEQGATLDFTIAPAYWQTIWFKTLCVLAFLGLLWMLYQLRLRQVTRAFELGLEARVAERTRIARELHDTLLQSFQGLVLRLQTAARLLPARPAEAKEVLESTMDQADQALDEGRDAVQGLRSSVVETPELADAIKTLGEELAGDAARDGFIPLSLRVEGTPRKLRAIVRDEIYRIAGEALRNAFRHSGATHIEVEIQYDERRFELRVRDDGKGIDPKLLSEQGGKHFGLSGVRERAEMIGGSLALWTSPNSGTELELKVPGARAYRAVSRPGSRLLERLSAVRGGRPP